MPSTLPEGEPAPADGLLPASAGEGAARRAFGVYVHVPYCRVRCGYCDFNTYTASELGEGASRADYASQLRSELAFGARALRASGVEDRQAATVFFGGGTPTLVPASDLVSMLDGVREQWGVAPGAEVTTEANPDSVDRDYLAALVEGGFTRAGIFRRARIRTINLVDHYDGNLIQFEGFS